MRSQVLGWGSGGLGLLYAGIGLGAVATAAVVPRVRERLSADRVFALGTALVALGLLRLAVLPTGSLRWCSASRRDRLAVLPLHAECGLSGGAALVGAGARAGAVPDGDLCRHRPRQRALGQARRVVRRAVDVGVRGVGGGCGRRAAPLAVRPHRRRRPQPGADGRARRPAGRRRGPATARPWSWWPTRSAPEAEEAFCAPCAWSEGRRRTGATDWSVYRDADRYHRYIETFVLPSWDEHVRQHQRRTVTDLELQEDIDSS